MPGMFFFAEGMPVVLNKSVWPGMKAVNGAVYTAHQAIIDQKFPGRNIGGKVWLHLGPPAGLLVSSMSPQGFEITGIPKGMLLLQPRSAMISSGIWWCWANGSWPRCSGSNGAGSRESRP